MRSSLRARLLDLADALGVRIVYDDLSHLDRDGQYDHETRTICLQEGMAPRLWAWTLAHELAHAYFGDVRTLFGPVNRKQERRADEWAAMFLVNLDDYREAEALRGGHLAVMAYDLGVVTDTLEVFQSLLLRIDDVVYFRARMGIGQWDRRYELQAVG